ncbi:hypothetical protein [Acinetobacter lanii]|uniref:Uncharacterized protein n=1 Tax=Acinetobacter lanii TaxID=2715163 RepID=A0A6G8S2T9_9GAMM|nr:hypothetical protein [Acinetobacter lanii]QIO08492.1 hypothetical protein G8D99_05305 [Acinetobacter lanii]
MHSNVWANLTKDVFWNADKTLAVYTKNVAKQTKVTILIKQDQHLREIDISQVEGMNLGKLALYRNDYYDRVETKPIEWVYRDDGKFQVNIQTRVWKNGKRQTVKEYVTFDKNGKVYWR